MKPLHVFFSIAIVASTLGFSSQLRAQDDPAAYLNTIIVAQNGVVQANLEYVQESVHNPDGGAVAAKRKKVIQQLDAAVADIGKLPAYKGSSKMATEALEVMKMYQETYTTDFSEAGLLKETSQESYEAMEAYLKAQEKAEKKLDQAGERFKKAQQAFCKEHALEINYDDRTANTLSVITEINAYQRKVFLIYFKASKVNSVYIDALNEQKAPNMEKARLELMTAATQGTTSLRTVGKFRGDDVYFNACKALLDFYHKKADKEYAELVTIVKRKDSLTEDDVKRWNYLLGEIGNGSASLVSGLTEASSRLMKNHIPKN